MPCLSTGGMGPRPLHATQFTGQDKGIATCVPAAPDTHPPLPKGMPFLASLQVSPARMSSFTPGWSVLEPLTHTCLPASSPAPGSLCPRGMPCLASLRGPRPAAPCIRHYSQFRGRGLPACVPAQGTQPLTHTFPCPCLASLRGGRGPSASRMPRTSGSSACFSSSPMLGCGHLSRTGPKRRCVPKIVWWPIAGMRPPGCHS